MDRAMGRVERRGKEEREDKGGAGRVVRELGERVGQWKKDDVGMSVELRMKGVDSEEIEEQERVRRRCCVVLECA